MRFLLLLLPHFSFSASIFRRIQASAERTGSLPRTPFSFVEDSAGLRKKIEVEKMNKKDRQGRHLRVGEWYPASSDQTALASGAWYRVPEARSLLTGGWYPVPSHPRLDTKGKVVSSQQRHPGSRIGRPSLLRPSLASSTTSGSLSIRDLFNTTTGGRFSPASRRSTGVRGSLGGRPSTWRSSPGSRVGRPSLLRSALSSSTSSASLSIGQFHK